MALGFFVEVSILTSVSVSIWPFMLTSMGGILFNVYMDIYLAVYSGINANICMGIHANVITLPF